MRTTLYLLATLVFFGLGIYALHLGKEDILMDILMFACGGVAGFVLGCDYGEKQPQK